MLLVIDIGNTNTTIGCYKGQELCFTARCTTDDRKTGDEYAIDLFNILRLNDIEAQSISDCVVSSVVPVVDRAFKYAVKKVIGKNPLSVGPGVKTGLNIKIDNPAQLGADLVAGAVAAISKYSLPCIVLDLGTATTISVIDENGYYLGGSICAGVGITLQALSSKTAQLPSVSIEAPKNPIGTNTIDCMKSGLVLGTAAMIDGMISRIEKQLGKKATIIGTGGLCQTVSSYCEREIIVDDNLLLDGLRIIYEKNM